jgi:DNA-binding CsgD family transcriptional regulator
MSANPVRGRAEERARTDAVLARAAAGGAGGVILIAGEPGIGKSALLRAVLDDARARAFAVGFGKADEREGIAPLAPLLLALRSGPQPLLSREQFAELAPLHSRRLWLVDRLDAMLEERAQRTPILIAIDDVHWADALTIFALRVLPGRLAGSPIVWALAARARPHAAIAEIADAAERETELTTLELHPLAPAAIDEIARDRGAPRDDTHLRALLERAGGYPFLAVELLDGYGAARVDDTTLPMRLIVSVRTRLESLAPDTLALVRAAAILGRTCALEDVAALLDITPWTGVLPALQAATDAGVLEDRGGYAEFRHDLFRQAVYEDIPPSQRMHMHRTIAERMLATGRGPLDAAPHVMVYAAPGDAAAVDVLRRAAAAVGASLPESAVDVILRAYALLAPDDPAFLATAGEAASLLADAGRERAAVDLLQRSLAATDADATTTELETLLLRLLWRIGAVDAMRARADAALARSDLGDRQRVELAALHALAISGAEDGAAAHEAGELALAEAVRLDAAVAQSDALRALAETALNDGRNVSAHAYLRRLHHGANDAPGSDEALTLQLLDRYDVSATVLAAARASGEDRRDTSRALAIAFAQMWHDYGLALLDDCIADAQTLLQLCEDLRDHLYRHEARLVLGRIAQIRGRLDEAREHFRLADDHTDLADENWDLRRSMMEAFAAERAGDLAGALRFTGPLIRTARGGRHRWRWAAHWLMGAVRIALRGGDRVLAAEAAAMTRVLADNNPGVATIAGIALHADGLVRGDLALLREASGVLLASPRPLVRADALVDLGSAELAAGAGREPASAAFDEAWEIYTRASADGESARLQTVLQAAGIRRRRAAAEAPRPLHGWGALTPTESRVARLIAEGHTNRSAAAELVLSTNTVATHLRAVFGKLGVNSRSQLTRLALAETANLT